MHAFALISNMFSSATHTQPRFCLYSTEGSSAVWLGCFASDKSMQTSRWLLTTLSSRRVAGEGASGREEASISLSGAHLPGQVALEQRRRWACAIFRKIQCLGRERAGFL